MMKLSIASVSDDAYGEAANNQSTAISIVLIMKLDDQPYCYLDHWVLACGAERTEKMAKAMISNLDSDIDELRRTTSQKTTTNYRDQ
jgi:hypothetical protein